MTECFKNHEERINLINEYKSSWGYKCCIESCNELETFFQNSILSDARTESLRIRAIDIIEKVPSELLDVRLKGLTEDYTGYWKALKKLRKNLHQVLKYIEHVENEIENEDAQYYKKQPDFIYSYVQPMSREMMIMAEELQKNKKYGKNSHNISFSNSWAIGRILALILKALLTQ